MDTIDWKKIFALAAILVLFNFYWRYFQVTRELQRRLAPWKETLKRIK